MRDRFAECTRHSPMPALRRTSSGFAWDAYSRWSAPIDVDIDAIDHFIYRERPKDSALQDALPFRPSEAY